MNWLLASCFLLFSATFCYAQEEDGFYFDNGTSLEQTDSLFKAHLSKGKLFLYVQGGIAPVVYAGDSLFEKKYRVTYYDFGCVAPDYTSILHYNSLVFAHLNKRHKDSWQKEIRKDVIGYDIYRKRKQMARMM